MIKKTITYPGFEGDELVTNKKKDIYFDMDILTAAKLMKSGFENGINDAQVKVKEIEKEVNDNTISETAGNIKVLELFSNMLEPLLAAAYNERRGDELVNKDENGEPLYKEFMRTKAYSMLLLDLLQHPETITAIIQGSIPKNIQDNPQYQAALEATKSDIEF